MIRRWKDKGLERFYRTGATPRRAGWAGQSDVVARKLDMLAAADSLEDLRAPPGNRLEALKGDRAGHWSIRVNARWRLCFAWRDGAAEEVECVDYH